MNNEEAIAVLQNELDGIPFDLDKSDFEQALEIAIKAIRNEPIDDLSEYSDKLWKQAYERGKAEARPKGEWIPVSERLPEGKIDPMTNDFELVLCSTVWEVVRPYKFGKPIGHSKAHFWSGGGIMDDYVIAWQPLPEPYKGAEND